MEPNNYQRSASLMSQNDTEKLQFFISCRNLADLDTVTVTDSFLIVKIAQPNQAPRQILRTKTVMNSLNPDYYETAIVDYEFEVRQMLTFEVYHDGREPVLVGRTEASVGEIFGHKEKRIIRPLVDNARKESGKIIVRCQVVPKTDIKIIEFNVNATRLPDMKFFYFFGNNSPFFRLMKRKNNENYLVYESEVAEDNRNPHFRVVKMNERKLCDNNDRAPIQCQFFNYSVRGNHDLVGEFFFTLAELGEHNAFNLTKKGSAVGHSQVIFSKVRRYRKYDFTEFISAGLEMQLIACIDFTGSNGVPNRPQSLHFIGSSNRTAYEEALKPVSEILLDYDADKLVPLYGFGAKARLPTFNTQGAVHHCFPLNGSTSKPEVYQVQGLLTTYRNCIKYLQFGGPTLFAPLLREAMQKSKYLKEQGNQYMIVMIMTDGEIHDMGDTTHELVQCARLPLSVIVVGIGNGDFKMMEELDDDDMRMTDKNGKRTERDLVQFVPFRDYNYNGVALAKHVLEELPRQVVEYHELCGIKPEVIVKPVPRSDTYLQMMQAK